MKKWLGIGIVLFLLTMVFVVMATANSTQQGQNLLQNPGFEGGWYDIVVGQVPNSWEWHWLNGAEHPESGHTVLQPESRVLPAMQLPAHERDIFLRDGSQCVKIFKGQSAIYTALSQDVRGLEAGRRYRFDVPIYVDTYTWDEKKLPPSDPNTAIILLGVGPVDGTWPSGAISYGGKWYGGGYLAYNVYSMEFVAPAVDITLYVEMSTKWSVDNSGFFLDGLGLYALEMAEPPTDTPPPPPPTNTPGPPPTAGPSPTPLPPPTPRPDGAIVHIVKPGDTIWTIAIEYASSMGMTPEAMKDQIERLNSFGQFLQIDQELVISTPNSGQPQPTGAPAAAPTAAGGEGELPAEVLAASPAPSDTVAVEPVAVPSNDGASNAICVLAYHDRNADGIRDPSTEGLLPNAEFQLSNPEGPVDVYTSDGVSEPRCFDELPAGTYMVEVKVPTNYRTTTPDYWAVPLPPGTTINVEFGHQRIEGSTEIITQDHTLEDSTQDSQSSEGGNDGGSDSIFSGLGDFVIGLSGVFVLLLAVAVGVAFFASRQR